MHLRSVARQSLRLFAVCSVFFYLQSCDTAPGAPEQIPNPPTLSNLSFTPLEFLYTGSGETAQIPLEITASVQNPGGGAVTVQYFVRQQFATETLAEGMLARGQGNTYSGGQTLSVPRGATGLYVITVTAVSNDGAVGNELTGLLEFSSESLGPPSIDEVDYPEVVVRPTGPVCEEPPNTENNPSPVPVQIIAAVSDPDGTSNINQVQISTGGSDFDMRDDGGQNSNSGDETAGDSRYTITFQIECFNSPGPIDFTIVASDRFGQESDPFDFTITVE